MDAEDRVITACHSVQQRGSTREYLRREMNSFYYEGRIGADFVIPSPDLAALRELIASNGLRAVIVETVSCVAGSRAFHPH